MRTFIFCLTSFVTGCATQSNVPSDQIWPEDRYMTRLEREVQEMCGDLIRDIEPGSVFVSWHDNLYPHAPMLSEAYVVSMFERSLIRTGFTVTAGGKDASYKLMLIMTPSRKSLLALASLWRGDELIATKEAHFINGPEKWSKVLCSYRLPTETAVRLGSKP